MHSEADFFVSFNTRRLQANKFAASQNTMYSVRGMFIERNVPQLNLTLFASRCTIETELQMTSKKEKPACISS